MSSSDLQSDKLIEEPSPLAYILAPIFIPPVWFVYQALYYTTSAVEFIKYSRKNLESKVDLINSSKNAFNR